MAQKFSNDGNDVALSGFMFNGLHRNSSSSSVSSYGKGPRVRVVRENMLEPFDISGDEMNLRQSIPSAADASMHRVDLVSSNDRSPFIRSPAAKRSVGPGSVKSNKPNGKVKSKLNLLRKTSRNPVLMSGHKKLENIRREASASSPTGTPTSSNRFIESSISDKRLYESKPLIAKTSPSNLSPSAPIPQEFPVPIPIKLKKGKCSSFAAPFPVQVGSGTKIKEGLIPASHPMACLVKENTPPSTSIAPSKHPMALDKEKSTKKHRSRKNKDFSDSESKDMESSQAVKYKRKGKKKLEPEPFPLAPIKTSSSSKVDLFHAILGTTTSSPVREKHDTPFSFTQLLGNKDPKTLCPFCDEQLPEEPSDRLLALLEQAREFSRPDPRIANKLGLSAPIERFIEVCQRHEFETVEVPKARRYGWPRKIDFNALQKRIKSRHMRKHLQNVVTEPALSVFWKEIATDIQKKGLRSVMSSIGQLATFSRTLPGYYGERGSVIIQQLLYTMFSPEMLPDDIFKPLNAAEFIQRVLLPEAGLQLIKEDQLCGEEEALETMRNSAIYGMGMFPDLGEEDTICVAIVEARAKKRRKEIEQEEVSIADPNNGSSATWNIEDIGLPTPSLTVTISGSSPTSVKRQKPTPSIEGTSVHDLKEENSLNTSSSNSKPRRPKPRPKIVNRTG